MTLRNPLIFRNWLKQPWSAAHRSQDGVSGRPLNVAILVGKDTFFRGAGDAPNYDYPNPTLPKSRQVAVNTTHEQQTDRINNLLKGKDTFFRGAGDAPSYDYPNPTLPKSRLVAIESKNWVRENRLLNLLIGKDTLPENQSDWPNPNRVKGVEGVSLRAQDYVFRDSLTTTLRGQDQLFGGPGQVPAFDWTNPVRGKEERGTSLRSVPDNWQNQLFFNLLGQDRLPENQSDWPLPTRKKELWGSALKSKDDVWQNRLVTTLVGQDKLPFSQDDWPLPIRPGPRQSESKSDLLITTLLGQDRLPENQSSWFNPEIKKSSLIQLTIPEVNLLPINNVPAPPVSGNIPRSGFVVNVGRLMGRGGM